MTAKIFKQGTNIKFYDKLWEISNETIEMLKGKSAMLGWHKRLKEGGKHVKDYGSSGRQTCENVEKVWRPVRWLSSEDIIEELVLNREIEKERPWTVI